MANGAFIPVTVTQMAALYRKTSIYPGQAMIPDVGYERWPAGLTDIMGHSPKSDTANGEISMPSRQTASAPVLRHCAYCKREQGQFPTCDGCGAAEWIAK